MQDIALATGRKIEVSKKREFLNFRDFIIMNRKCMAWKKKQNLKEHLESFIL